MQNNIMERSSKLTAAREKLADSFPDRQHQLEHEDDDTNDSHEVDTDDSSRVRIGVNDGQIPAVTSHEVSLHSAAYAVQKVKTKSATAATARSPRKSGKKQAAEATATPTAAVPTVNETPVMHTHAGADAGAGTGTSAGGSVEEEEAGVVGVDSDSFGGDTRGEGGRGEKVRKEGSAEGKKDDKKAEEPTADEFDELSEDLSRALGGVRGYDLDALDLEMDDLRPEDLEVCVCVCV